MVRPAALVLSIYALAPWLAAAEVVDSAAGGFTVRTTLSVRAAPAEVFRRLVRNVGDWWDSSHTFSGDARNMSIEERAGGCFCEKLPGGGGVRHMQVILLEPGKRLVMSGGIGPLMQNATTGSLTITLTPQELGGTKLEATYAVAGYLPAGLDSWADPVDQVLGEQFARLKRYVETGTAAEK